MSTDTTERGLDRLICTALTGHACDPPAAGEVRDPAPTYRRPRLLYQPGLGRAFPGSKSNALRTRTIARDNTCGHFH